MFFSQLVPNVLFPVTRFLNMPKAPGIRAIFTTHKSQTVTWNRDFSLPSKQAFKDIAYWWKRNGGEGALLHQESVQKSSVWVLLFGLFLNSYLFVYFYYFGLCWIFIVARAFLWLQKAEATLWLWCLSFSCSRAQALGNTDFSSCGMWVQ